VGEAYAAAIRGARLETEEPGRSPLAWQGARVSAVIAEVAAAAGEGGLLRPADPPERAS
jgi:hypothetical protein